MGCTLLLNLLIIVHCIQVETIGDAYCVAGGLHKESETHAVQIALMALKMMELSNDVMTPTGEPIQVTVKYCLIVIIQLDVAKCLYKFSLEDPI